MQTNGCAFSGTKVVKDHETRAPLADKAAAVFAREISAQIPCEIVVVTVTNYLLWVRHITIS